jgi:hypothetical protein
MKDPEILNEAINKINFDFFKEFDLLQGESAIDDLCTITMGYDCLTLRLGWIITKGRSRGFINYEAVIFSHSFAKAYFGTEIKTIYLTSELAKTIEEEKDLYKIEAWIYHIAEMAKAKNRLQYIKKFL